MNADKIISVLEKEPGLCANSMTRSGVSCFIGALLIETGYTPQRIRELEGHLIPNTVGPYDRVKGKYPNIPASRTAEYWARKRLKEVYEMTDADIDAGISNNDSLRKVEWRGLDLNSKEVQTHRRDHMIKWVRERAAREAE